MSYYMLNDTWFEPFVEDEPDDEELTKIEWEDMYAPDVEPDLPNFYEGE